MITVCFRARNDDEREFRLVPNGDDCTVLWLNAVAGQRIRFVLRSSGEEKRNAKAVLDLSSVIS